MKVLILFLLIILTIFSFTVEAASDIVDVCLDQDVWVDIKHSDPWEDTCIVIVYVPKHSLQGDFYNCPAEDTEVIGEGRKGFGLTVFDGMHVLTLPKGMLNDSSNYRTTPPRKIKVPANNRDTWHVSK